MLTNLRESLPFFQKWKNNSLLSFLLLFLVRCFSPRNAINITQFSSKTDSLQICMYLLHLLDLLSLCVSTHCLLCYWVWWFDLDFCFFVLLIFRLGRIYFFSLRFAVFGCICVRISTSFFSCMMYRCVFELNLGLFGS